MLECCPACGAGIESPYARFCAVCGLEFATLKNTQDRSGLSPKIEQER